MLRPLALVLSVLLPATVAGCPVYPTSCLEEGDGGDCAKGFVCQNDVCVRKVPDRAPDHCHDDDDCPLGKICGALDQCVDAPSGAAGEGGVPGSAGVGGQTRG